MLKTPIKTTLLIGFIASITAIFGWFAIKYISTDRATQIAQEIIETASRDLPSQASDDEKVIALTKHVFETFQSQDPATIPLYRIRSYITNARLPEFIRLPHGVMETHMQAGYCDNAARMLSFLLRQAGFDSVQWNMITDTAAHSAILVRMPDTREVFVDPFYGVTAMDDAGKLTHINNAQNARGRLVPFNDQAIHPFYNSLQTMRMAAQGEDLLIAAAIPPLKTSALMLGRIDGQDKDVKRAALDNKMMPHWDYMGHKYNREWVRVLSAEQPVKLVMTLLAPAEDGVLTATPRPQIDGKTLTWTLDAGENITFRDGLAQISFKRMNSYIGVDQIAIYPLD